MFEWRAPVSSALVSKFTPLPRAFYEPSAKVVAPKLLGHFLVRNTPTGPAGGIIVETEAYLSNDPACHGAPGPTTRNKVMFGGPGHGYIYLIYGYHFCVNAVCRPVGVAEAVLIRAIEPTFGTDFMRHERPVTRDKDLTNGPAKLCEALGIDRGLDGVDICNSTSAIFIAENPGVSKARRQKAPIVTATRIGITKAAALLLRFYLEGSDFVSKR
jgi:DNA-3-methyladenine glycosylase